MKARPILMHGRSITNLLTGRKSQTRRIVKPQPLFKTARNFIMPDDAPPKWHDCDDVRELCPKGQPGDLLYVRETWSPEHAHWRDEHGSLIPQHVEYRADWDGIDDSVRWVPSIHMPRWASRLTLHLTDVRLERVQEISEDDAVAEGVDGPAAAEAVGTAPSRNTLLPCAVHGFSKLWDDTNGAGAWDRNDWCWALCFEVVRVNVDEVLAEPERFGITEGVTL